MPDQYSYLLHLCWMLPVIVIQYIVGLKILLRNLRPILLTTLIVGTYYSLSDYIAVAEEIWYFDPEKISGVMIGHLPVEEILFFFLTAFLVAQSLILLLPEKLRL